MAKVLIVDDEAMISSALSRVISKLGHQTEIAANGLQAINKLESDTFDLMIMDLLMPELNGFELLNWVKSHRPELSVIAMTAYGDQIAKEQLLQSGVALVLAKPFDNIFDVAENLADLLAKKMRPS